MSQGSAPEDQQRGLKRARTEMTEEGEVPHPVKEAVLAEYPGVDVLTLEEFVHGCPLGPWQAVYSLSRATVYDMAALEKYPDVPGPQVTAVWDRTRYKDWRAGGQLLGGRALLKLRAMAWGRRSDRPIVILRRDGVIGIPRTYVEGTTIHTAGGAPVNLASPPPVVIASYYLDLIEKYDAVECVTLTNAAQQVTSLMGVPSSVGPDIEKLVTALTVGEIGGLFAVVNEVGPIVAKVAAVLASLYSADAAWDDALKAVKEIKNAVSVANALSRFPCIRLPFLLPQKQHGLVDENNRPLAPCTLKDLTDAGPVLLMEGAPAPSQILAWAKASGHTVVSAQAVFQRRRQGADVTLEAKDARIVTAGQLRALLTLMQSRLMPAPATQAASQTATDAMEVATTSTSAEQAASVCEDF